MNKEVLQQASQEKFILEIALLIKALLIKALLIPKIGRSRELDLIRKIIKFK